jgi:hypothetical protein
MIWFYQAFTWILFFVFHIYYTCKIFLQFGKWERRLKANNIYKNLSLIIVLSLNWSLHFIISKAMLCKKKWWKRGEVTRIMYNEILQFHSSFWIVSFCKIFSFQLHVIGSSLVLWVFFFCHTETYLCDNNLYCQTKNKPWTKFGLLFWVTKYLLWWPMYKWNLFWKHVKQQHLETKFNVVVEWVE